MIENASITRESIRDGAVIWCDAAPNTVNRVVNGYGKQAKFDNGGYRAGVLVETPDGDHCERFINRSCPDQFAAECWSVLKAVELAKECELQSVTIRNDRISSFTAVSQKKSRKGYIGSKYLYVAKRIAEAADLDVTFDRCTGAENRADRVSRTEK